MRITYYSEIDLFSVPVPVPVAVPLAVAVAVAEIFLVG